MRNSKKRLAAVSKGRKSYKRRKESFLKERKAIASSHRTSSQKASQSVSRTFREHPELLEQEEQDLFDLFEDFE